MTMSDSDPRLFEHRRTIWDVVLGVITVIAGGIVLGHVAVASLVSILFIGWMLLIGGIALVVSGLVGWKQPAQRWNLATGAILGILGFGFVRNPGAGLLVLTLLAGSLLLAAGVIRLIAAFQPAAPRAVLLFNGVVTLILGFMVVNSWPSSALWLLGTILGVQMVVDGLTTAIVGRVRPVEVASIDRTTTVASEPQPQA
jgi:membrane protein HdeD